MRSKIFTLRTIMVGAFIFMMLGLGLVVYSFETTPLGFIFFGIAFILALFSVFPLVYLHSKRE